MTLVIEVQCNLEVIISLCCYDNVLVIVGWVVGCLDVMDG